MPLPFASPDPYQHECPLRLLSLTDCKTSAMPHYVGQRLSLKQHACTVRYIGTVAGKSGDFLGVEWDDPARGKHDGTHDGTKYFECRHPSPTAASFLKPSQAWDKPRTFLQALREKYMPEDAGTGAEIVYFSSKKAEEIGFHKFARRQAQLRGIHTIVLDHMRIRHQVDAKESEEISRTCGHVTELDLSGNLFESLQDVLDLAALMPKLSVLTLNSNRVTIDMSSSQSRPLQTVRTLSFANVYLSWAEIASALKYFPKVSSLSASHNGLTTLSSEALPQGLKTLDLSENDFSALSDVAGLSGSAGLETISLKRCRINTVSDKFAQASTGVVYQSVRSIDLSSNDIASWSFYDELSLALPSLKDLHVAGNPLYKDLLSAEGNPLTSADGYMLTIARLPQLKTLNYSSISDKVRLNAETYYLSQIAAELSRVVTEDRIRILKTHPRWRGLCEEYGEPTIRQQSAETGVNPNTLAARLVTFDFELAPGVLQGAALRSWSQRIPKSLNIYALLGLVGQKLGVAPLKLRLVWQTGERDPIGQHGAYTGPEWWDSSDDDGEATHTPDGRFVAREVLLVAGTRPIGTYIEHRRALVRIEVES